MRRAQEETGYRGPEVVRTVEGVGEALRVDERARFYRQLLMVGTGGEFDGLVNLYWPLAVIEVAEDPQAAEDFADLALAYYSMACGELPRRHRHELAMREVGEAS
ncbi:hypothetical protein [Streptomyces lichenis]|uniref:NUDIX hydrolase n=1 Tax=Streptomyces lichenis TaxID=2306967 RepID=A0ABT0I7A5_9ACTN|nr:hypothetical protein [Streptomyces lichenis]MCK8677177.1 hypothetical protein [Streptomyces lichenis]